jgi:PST family polysaccharide transporter
MAPVGVISVLVLGINGVVPALVLAPAAGFFAALYFLRRRESAIRLPLAMSNLGPMLRRILPLGGAVMISSFAEMLGRLGALSVISADFGESGVGLVHSGWSIASMYMGFVLSAMAVDYLPRLSSASNDDERVAMINETLLASWVLILPLTLMIYTAAPWVLQLLYSSEFAAASESLRWQLVGDLFKVPVWLFAYLLIARGRSLSYLVKQLITQLCIVGGTYVLLPRLGLVGFGLAFALGQLATAIYLFWEARRLTAFVAERQTLRVFGMGVLAFSGMVFATYALPEGPAFISMAIVTVLTSAVCARILWKALEGDARRIPVIGRLIASISRRR